ncbi:hypothetical protein BGX20_004627, partial [Mortierella sp. AD010]
MANYESANYEAVNYEAANDEAANDEAANDETTNDETTNDEAANYEATDDDPGMDAISKKQWSRLRLTGFDVKMVKLKYLETPKLDGDTHTLIPKNGAEFLSLVHGLERLKIFHLKKWRCNITGSEEEEWVIENWLLLTHDVLIGHRGVCWLDLRVSRSTGGSTLS